MAPAKKVIVKVDGIDIKDAVVSIEAHAALIAKKGGQHANHHAKGIIEQCQKIKRIIGPIPYERA